MKRALCSDCGKGFFREEGETWKTLCIPCFKRGKDSERQAELEQANSRALAAETEAANLRGQLRQAHAEARHFFEMAMERQAEICALRERATIADDLHEHLPRLLLCCHPDKHGNSRAATLATQYLLQLRTRLH